MVAFRICLQIGTLTRMKTIQRAEAVKQKKGFHVRIPAALRARIDEARKTSGRSVNAELVARIEASLDADQPDLIATVEKLRRAVEALNKRLDEK